MYILSKSQIEKLTSLSNKFIEDLRNTHTDLESEAKTLWGGQAFGVFLHSPKYQRDLGMEGYNVDGQLNPLKGFYEISISPIEDQMWPSERVDIGFGHIRLKQQLETILGPPEISTNKELRNCCENQLDRPTIFSRNGGPMSIQNVLKWSSIHAILGIYDSYEAEPVNYSGYY
jgi:hypothetical protein